MSMMVLMTFILSTNELCLIYFLSMTGETVNIFDEKGIMNEWNMYNIVYHEYIYWAYQ